MIGNSIRLADGRILAVRPVWPRDAEAVQQFVRGLSWSSRRQRFFAPIAELTPRQLERAVSAPGLHLAACDADGRFVALAEYALEGERQAEFGVVVDDAWQGQGVGEALMKILVEHARRAGVLRLEGVTQVQNRAMRAVASRLGFAFRGDEDPDLVRMERALAG